MSPTTHADRHDAVTFVRTNFADNRRAVETYLQVRKERATALETAAHTDRDRRIAAANRAVVDAATAAYLDLAVAEMGAAA